MLSHRLRRMAQASMYKILNNGKNDIFLIYFSSFPSMYLCDVLFQLLNISD